MIETVCIPRVIGSVYRLIYEAIAGFEHQVGEEHFLVGDEGYPTAHSVSFFLCF